MAQSPNLNPTEILWQNFYTTVYKQMPANLKEVKQSRKDALVQM